MNRRVWRYQREVIRICISKNNRQIQWSKEKVQKDKQWSTKHTHKSKDRVTRTPIKIMGELRRSERVRSSCSTSDTRRVTLITNPVISDEWGKCLRQVEHIRGNFWHRYSITVNFLFITVYSYEHYFYSIDNVVCGIIYLHIFNTTWLCE